MRLWCAKEAAAKALGKACPRGLHTIRVTNAETDTGLVQLELADRLLEDYREFQGKSMIAYLAGTATWIWWTIRVCIGRARPNNADNPAGGRISDARTRVSPRPTCLPLQCTQEEPFVFHRFNNRDLLLEHIVNEVVERKILSCRLSRRYELLDLLIEIDGSCSVAL